MKKNNDILQEIMTEMFSMVGKEYSEEYTKQDKWYALHEWTTAQEDVFKKWLISYFKRHKFRRPAYEAGWFLLCYGWKTKKEE